MENYPLAPMLKVRLLHEDQAKRLAVEAEERVKSAEKYLSDCQGELSRYHIWRPQEEDRRFAAIVDKPLGVEKLGVFREQLAQLAQGEKDRELKVLEAEKLLRERQAQAREASEAVIFARKACMKLEEHRAIWLAEKRKEEERLSDLEMEESRGPARVSDES